jgi:hypothetical protein
MFLKGVHLFLSLFIIAQGASGFAADQATPKTEAPANRTPVAYHAEETRNVINADGGYDKIYGDVKLLQPSDEEGLNDAETQVGDALAQADKNQVPVTFVVEDDRGQMIDIASRPAFLEFLRKMKEGSKKTLREMNSGALKDFKNMPVMTLAMISVRGGVNYWGGFKMALFMHFSHNQSVVAGATSFILSAALLAYGSFYAKWLKIDQSYPVLLAKGFVVQYVYLALLKAAMSVAGADMNSGAVDFIWSTATASLIGTLAQTPFAVSSATLADEYAVKHAGENLAVAGKNFGPKESLAVGVRNFASVMMSAYIAYVTALQISGNPHAEMLSYAVGVPATIFVAYKQNWLGKAKGGLQWIKQKAMTTTQAANILAFENFNFFLENLAQDNHDSALRRIVQASAESMDELRAPTCRAMAELADPQ